MAGGIATPILGRLLSDQLRFTYGSAPALYGPVTPEAAERVRQLAGSRGWEHAAYCQATRRLGGAGGWVTVRSFLDDSAMAWASVESPPRRGEMLGSATLLARLGADGQVVLDGSTLVLAGRVTNPDDTHAALLVVPELHGSDVSCTVLLPDLNPDEHAAVVEVGRQNPFVRAWSKEAGADVLRPLGLGLGAAWLLAAMFLVRGALAAVFDRARPAIAMLRHVGASPGALGNALLLSFLTLVSLGIVLGIALGNAAAGQVSETLSSALGHTRPWGGAITPGWVLFLAAATLVGAAVSARAASRGALRARTGTASHDRGITPRLGVTRQLVVIAALGGSAVAAGLLVLADERSGDRTFLAAIGLAFLPLLALDGLVVAVARGRRRKTGLVTLAARDLARHRRRFVHLVGAAALSCGIAGALVIGSATLASAEASSPAVQPGQVLVTGHSGFADFPAPQVDPTGSLTAEQIDRIHRALPGATVVPLLRVFTTAEARSSNQGVRLVSEVHVISESSSGSAAIARTTPVFVATPELKAALGLPAADAAGAGPLPVWTGVVEDVQGATLQADGRAVEWTLRFAASLKTSVAPAALVEVADVRRLGVGVPVGVLVTTPVAFTSDDLETLAHLAEVNDWPIAMPTAATAYSLVQRLALATGIALSTVTVAVGVFLVGAACRLDESIFARLGACPAQLRRLRTWRALILAGLAILFALPMWAAAGRILAAPPHPAHVVLPPTPLMLLALGMFGAALAVTWLPRGRQRDLK